jgi:hypothetical protein
MPLPPALKLRPQSDPPAIADSGCPATLDLGLQFQHQQHGRQACRRLPGTLHKFVQRRRFMTKFGPNRRYSGSFAKPECTPKAFLVVAARQLAYISVVFATSRAASSPPSMRAAGANVSIISAQLHQPRAIANQTMAAAGERIMDGAGQREHLPTLFTGQPRGDQRAGLQPCLDHQRTQRQPGNDPVASRKMIGTCRRAGRKFADQRASCRRSAGPARDACADRPDPVRYRSPPASARHYPAPPHGRRHRYHRPCRW